MTIAPPEDLEPIKLKTPVKEEPVTQNNVLTKLPPIDNHRELEIKNQAINLTKNFTSMNMNSPEFKEQLVAISKIGEEEILKSGEGVNSLLSQKGNPTAMRKHNNSNLESVSDTLSELRNTVEELTPNAADLTTTQKILGIIPGGNKLKRYFQKFETDEKKLDRITQSLMSGRDQLLRDNESIHLEMKKLYHEVLPALHEYLVFADNIDSALENELVNLRNSGKNDDANIVETDLLPAIKGRRTDIMTQLCVALQGYLAMNLTYKSNVEMIKGVDRSLTTTIYALKTAIAVAKALNNQRLVMDQVKALDASTNNVIEQTSIMLHEQSIEIQKGTVESRQQLASTLVRAFDNIYATMDEVDNFKRSSNDVLDNVYSDLSNAAQQAEKYIQKRASLTQ